MLPVIVPCLLRHISVNLFDDDDDNDDDEDDDENAWVTTANKFEGLRQANRNFTLLLL